MQPPIVEPSSPNAAGMLSDEQRRSRLKGASYSIFRTLWHTRRLILGLTAGGAVVAIVISLMMPNEYRSSARVLLPETGGSMAAMLGNLPPQAARLLGAGPSGDYTRYLAILTSESMMDRVIEEFDLIRVYEKENSVQPRADTRHHLRRMADFEVNMQFDFLTISVLDRDRERASQMANFFVAELNRRNADLTAQNAGNYRRYVERRYQEVLAELEASQRRLQEVQEEIGVVELPAVTEAFYRGAAEHRANSLQLEIQHGALLRQYGPENPQVAAASEALAIARRAEASAMRGMDPLLPIASEDMPAAANRYATAFRDVLIQTELLQIAQPLYEQARFEEEREKVAVQVVDVAEPAERKAKPVRSLIVVSTTVSVFILSILFVLGMMWIRTEGLPRWNALRSSEMTS